MGVLGRRLGSMNSLASSLRRSRNASGNGPSKTGSTRLSTTGGNPMKPIDFAGTVVSRLAAHLFTLVMDKKIRFGILGFVMASSLGAGLAIPNTVARAATQSTPKIACLQQSAWGFGTVASVCLESI